MNYKTWTDEELIRQGKKLADAIPRAWQIVKSQQTNTAAEKYKLAKDIEAINLGEHTLQLLRNEYRNRKNLQP